MNVFAEFQARVAALIEKRIAAGDLPEGLDLSRFVVEPPRDAAHGDLSTNAAMVYAREAKAVGSNPRRLAETIAADLAGEPGVAGAEVAGPGFINVILKPEVYQEVLKAVLVDGERFGAGAPGGETVNVEYVSANPTGPMHVGHARGAVFGDALASLLSFAGRQATREYYINDAGAQVNVLARSAHLRYREALGEAIGAIPEGFYPGDYLKPVGEALKAEFGAGLSDQPEAYWLPLVRQRAIAAMMAMIRDDLAALAITHEVFASERALTGVDGGPNRVEEAIEALRAKGLVYEGRLPPPKGAPAEDWEDREQILFRSTAYGDDVDRPLVKSDGSYTYFASDIAYHKTKIDRGFLTLVDVWGADHGGYVKRMQAAVAALSGNAARLEVRLCQLVRLMRAGEQVKMSKRSGDFVTLREVVDEVGPDAVRFIMLMRKNDAPLDFDLAKVIEQSQDNPVFYVQYAHARAHSVLRQGLAAFPDLDLAPSALAGGNSALLTDEGERDLLRALAQYPRAVLQAAEAHEPHRIAFYAHDLATRFHAHWNRGKDFKDLRFVNEKDRNLSYARLGLVAAVGLVLASALSILGVSAPEEMR
ncbi:arginyl-tRNA synthetase [Roseiarcus fermentans]|uniref:Arginine--tRNA ligase n=1 Tax=Roseiarcus fermentans TaxID=1473586 RepID=A0A366EEX5_9HYPH|nr:arginine--tRNA ligase [Roseiarcus fermentans]RBP00964.1 arginyl-tRNA synthetase [Roseiarcus fermentans]